jgi:hypothetical protein
MIEAATHHSVSAGAIVLMIGAGLAGGGFVLVCGAFGGRYDDMKDAGTPAGWYRPTAVTTFLVGLIVLVIGLATK